MNAKSVQDLARKLKNFGGIFSVDQLAYVKIISYPVALIVNDENHWIAIYISDNVVEVCDSSGYLKNDNLDLSLRKLLKLHFYNKDFFATPRLQSDDSQNCALYCLSYLYIRLILDKTLCDFTSLFTTDTNVNCSIISDIFREIKPLL